MPISEAEPPETMPSKPALRLLVSALWGETVLATRELRPREALALDGPTGRDVAQLPGPDDLLGVPARVFSPSPGGWRLDAAGTTGGFIQQADKRTAAREKPEVVLANAGDFGVLEYGPQYALFFQTTLAAPALGRRLRPSLVACLALALSCALILGSLLLFRVLTQPLGESTLRGGLSPGIPMVRAEATLSNASKLNASEAAFLGNDEANRQLLELVGALRAGSSAPGNGAAPSSKPQEASARIPVWDRSASAMRIFGGNQGLTEAQVNRALGAHMDALQACLSTDEAAGQIVVRIGVEPDGSIDSATMTHSSLANPTTERCVLREARRLNLPAASRPTTVHLILVMRKN